jgi:hypothetical protein
MFSPFGNGHHPGATPGRGGAGRPAPRTGTWPRRAARGAGTAGQLASRCGEAGPGPSISYMEGPGLILPGRNAIPSTSTGAGTARRRPPECATAMTRGHDRGRARSVSGWAAAEDRQAQRQQACEPAAPASRTPRRAGLLPAASPAAGLPAGFVCTSMWITCVKRHQACARAVEMLGIPPPGCAHERALNWENTTRSMCTMREAGIVHTPRREGS